MTTGRLRPHQLLADTSGELCQVYEPVLVLHSPDDEIMPFELGVRVFKAANEPKSFVRMRRCIS